MFETRCLGKINLKKENQLYFLGIQDIGKIGFSPEDKEDIWYIVGEKYYQQLPFLLADKNGKIVRFDPVKKEINFEEKGIPIIVTFAPKFDLTIAGQTISTESQWELLQTEKVYFDRPQIRKIEQESIINIPWLMILIFLLLLILVVILFMTIFVTYQNSYGYRNFRTDDYL